MAIINGTDFNDNNTVQGGQFFSELNGTNTSDVIYGYAGNDILFGFDGSDVLFGGRGADTMTGGLGGDSYYVDNVGDVIVESADVGVGNKDTVYATVSYALSANIEQLYIVGTGNLNGAGNAQINFISGNRFNNILNGGAGNDRLVGNAGNDTLNGGFGKDTLLGVSGNDILNGGAGPDNYQFVAALGAGNVDMIIGYSVADDTITLNPGVFDSFLGSQSGPLNATMFKAGGIQDANDFIIYNTATGALSYDADANGAGAAVQFATLSLVGGFVPPLTAADFLVV